MMYAVVQSGGKQYRVGLGDTIRVEKLDTDAGATVSLDQVLLLADGDKVEVGTPTLGTPVVAEVIGHGRGDKIQVFKMKRRKNSRRSHGHRQDYTELRVVGIGDQQWSGPAAAPVAAESEPAPESADEVEQG